MNNTTEGGPSKRLSAHRYVAEQRKKRQGKASFALFLSLSPLSACACVGVCIVHLFGHGCVCVRRRGEGTSAEARTHALGAPLAVRHSST